MNLDKNDPKWKKLLDGEIKKEFKLVAAGLCVSRNQREYRMDHTPATLSKCVDDLIAFFSKYEKLVSDDLAEVLG